MDREYVVKKGTALVPTYTGMVVTELLRRYFDHFIDVTFTAQMEDRLDDIADGKVDWLKFLADFYKGGGDFGDGLHPAIEKQLPGMDFAAIPLGKDPKSGEDVVVKVGRFGPFVQRGSGDTSLLATIPPDAIPDEFRLDQALTALEQKTKGDDVIGTYPPTGEPIYLIRNYRGAYLQVGETPPKEKGKKATAAPKPRRASLTAEDDADNLTLERALKLLELPRLLGNHPETGKPVEANNGMFGPYVAHDGEYRSLKKDDDVYTVTLERAVELMFVPKSWRGGPRAAPKLLRELGSHPDTGRGVRLFDMGGAPTLYDGKTTTVLSRSVDPKSLALDEALVILSEAAAKAAPKKGRGAKKASTKAPAKPRAKKTATKPATRKSAPKSTAGAKKVAKKPAAKKVSAK